MFIGLLLATSLLVASAQRADSLADLLAMKRFAEALTAVTILIKSNPTDPRLWTVRGIALTGLNKIEDAFASYDRALKIQPSFLPALRAASETAYSSRHKRAKSYLQRLVQADPKSEPAHAMAAVLAFEARDCRAAVTHFRSSSSEISGNEVAVAQFGHCLLDLGAVEETVQTFQQQLESTPDNTRVRYNLAVAQLRSANPASAIMTLAPLSDSRDSDVLSLLAAVQDSAGHTEDAIATLRTAVAIAPQDERHYLDLAALYQKSALLPQAVEFLDVGLRRVPQSARLFAMRGVVLAQIGELEKAEADFEQAGSLEPDQTYSAAGLSVLFSETGRSEGAAKLLRQKLAQSPNDAALNCILADALLREGARPGQAEFVEARTALLRAVRARPNLARARASLGKIYLREDKALEAIQELNLALELDPANRPALSQLSAALRKAGRQKEAAVTAERLRRQYERDLQAESVRKRIRLAPESEPER